MIVNAVICGGLTFITVMSYGCYWQLSTIARELRHMNSMLSGQRHL